MNNSKMNILYFTAGFALVAVLGTFGYARAFSGTNSGVVCESGSNCTTYQDAGGDAGVAFGGTSNFDDLGVDSITADDGTLEITGAMTLSGALSADRVTSGGGVNATTTPASMTLAEDDLLSYSRMDTLLSVGSVTYTFPASSTVSSFIPNAGDQAAFVIENATTTPTATITLAGGTGTSLYGNNATSSPFLINGGEFAQIIFTRGDDTDIDVLVDLYN